MTCIVFFLLLSSSTSVLAQTWTTALFPTAFSHSASRSTVIRITFNRAIQASSIADTTFSVFGFQSGAHTGIVSYDTSTRIATFTPSNA
ncbi:MAG TPA: Ig-like domain-containing protein, partial [Bacteroidota bacterium]|nr:Ig-like domain-containing protein [Bacteroidota bacterium]